MTFRVYVDNAQGFARVGNEIPMEEVTVKLTFPGSGLALSAGELETKTIGIVNPGQIRFVDFSVESDGITYGDLGYKVQVTSTPGGSKTITGTVRVSTTPKLNVAVDANLIGLPWKFDDTSYEAVLGLQTPEDFRAYKWNAAQGAYVIAPGVERGFGHWIVSNADFGPIDLQSNPQLPPDIPTGAPNIQLKSGWNLISNPYPYAIQFSQIVGVPGGSQGSGVLTWPELISAGYINSALAYYDAELDDYVFVQANDGTMFPNRGYWIYLNTQNDLTLSYPAVFAPFLPGSSRANGTPWSQTERQWRLQFAARTSKSQDAQNYVGLAKNADSVKKLQVAEVPGSPVSTVGLSIEETVNGQPLRMSQVFTDKLARKTWKMYVNSTEAGTVTLSWPNLSTIPKNVRFRITDIATGAVRDVRQSSGYTYTTDQPSVRQFQVEMIPGQTVRATIGNVVVTRSRAPLAPFSIRYTLSSDANTTIRILSGSGKEVYSVHRGRADKTGENEVQWAMRDNANRLVAPGTYRVEILAETATGERVRTMVPLNVIR
jgi:hypothetical protein